MAAQLPRVPVPPGEPTVDFALSAPHALIRALRKRADEVQLTEVIGALASVDTDFARGFVDVLLRQAREDCPAHRAALEALGPVPDTVVGRTERRLLTADGPDLGRIDLVFTDADPRGEFTLLVENKLDSDPHATQLSNYRDWAIENNPRTALIAVTRELPGRGELRAGEPGYLGSVRWGRLFTSLKAVQFHPGAREQWCCFLDVLNEREEFGLTEFDAQAVRGWAHYRSGGAMLAGLLELLSQQTLAHTLDELRALPALAPSPSRSGSQYPEAIVGKLAALRREGKVRPWLEEGLAFFVSMPAGAASGFYVYAWVADGEVSFGITVIVSDPQQHARLQLHEKHFVYDPGSGWHSTHPGAAVLDATDADRPRTLMNLVKGDITALVSSRFLAPELDVSNAVASAEA